MLSTSTTHADLTHYDDLTTSRIRDYIHRTPAKSGVGIETLDNYRDRHTPRACFLLSYAHAHLNYGGAYGAAERLAGW